MDSAFKAELQGGQEYRGWGVAPYLLAQVIDSVREGTYAFVAANSKKKPKAPEPFPRPKSKTSNKTKKNSRFAVMARMAYNGGRKVS